GIVTAVRITNPGSGYTSAPLLTFAGGGTPGTTPARAIGILSAPLTTTGTITRGSNAITNLQSASGLGVGGMVIGSGIPDDTVITAIRTGAATITRSNNASASATGVSLTIIGP